MYSRCFHDSGFFLYIYSFWHIPQKNRLTFIYKLHKIVFTWSRYSVIIYYKNGSIQVHLPQNAVNEAEKCKFIKRIQESPPAIMR